jgi:hypothetical protein
MLFNPHYLVTAVVAAAPTATAAAPALSAADGPEMMISKGHGRGRSKLVSEDMGELYQTVKGDYSL